MEKGVERAVLCSGKGGRVRVFVFLGVGMDMGVGDRARNKVWEGWVGGEG